MSVTNHTGVRLRQPRRVLLLLSITEHTHATEALLVRGLPAPGKGTQPPRPRHRGKTEKDHGSHTIDGVEHRQPDDVGVLLGEGGRTSQPSLRARPVYHLNASS
jgi:hypothetical protein